MKKYILALAIAVIPSLLGARSSNMKRIMFLIKAKETFRKGNDLIKRLTAKEAEEAIFIEEQDAAEAAEKLLDAYSELKREQIFFEELEAFRILEEQE